jgi:hypothetical protein
VIASTTRPDVRRDSQHRELCQYYRHAGWHKCSPHGWQSDVQAGEADRAGADHGQGDGGRPVVDEAVHGDEHDRELGCITDGGGRVGQRDALTPSRDDREHGNNCGQQPELQEVFAHQTQHQIEPGDHDQCRPQHRKNDVRGTARRVQVRWRRRSSTSVRRPAIAANRLPGPVRPPLRRCTHPVQAAKL